MQAHFYPTIKEKIKIIHVFLPPSVCTEVTVTWCGDNLKMTIFVSLSRGHCCDVPRPDPSHW